MKPVAEAAAKRFTLKAGKVASKVAKEVAKPQCRLALNEYIYPGFENWVLEQRSVTGKKTMN